MRRRKRDLSVRVNGPLEFEAGVPGLTSYAGLEVIRQYLGQSGFREALRRHLGSVGLRGDFPVVSMVLLLVGLLIVGGRRLQHVRLLEGDPIVRRFSGLRLLPGDRTLSRWLKQFRKRSVRPFQNLNSELVARAVKGSHLRTLTIDVDGTVVSTGLQVERARRGYNPHHRKVPSYYPITAYLAETGHVLRVENRSGNVHDGKASLQFLRDLFDRTREDLGSETKIRMRMDGAFFHNKVIRLLEARGVEYAIKAPFWPWLNLQGLIQAQREWTRVASEVEGFSTSLLLEPWNLDVRIRIYRRRVAHATRKNYQLDLFDPNNGTYEYSAVITNLSWDLGRVWHFMCGRGAHEKVIGELKHDLAFATIPTNRYGANCAWQQIVVLAHTVMTNFQIETGAPRRGRNRKRTALYVLKRVQTMRFELIARAGYLVRPNGKAVLRLGTNEKVLHRFRQALRWGGQAA